MADFSESASAKKSAGEMADGGGVPDDSVSFAPDSVVLDCSGGFVSSDIGAIRLDNHTPPESAIGLPWSRNQRARVLNAITEGSKIDLSMRFICCQPGCPPKFPG